MTKRCCMLLGYHLLVYGLLTAVVHGGSLWPPQTKLVEGSLDAAPDPVSASDGSFYFNMSLLELGGPMNLGFRLRYHSNQPRSNWDLSDLPSWGKWWWDPKATCIRMSMGDHEVLQFQVEHANPIAFVQYPDEDWRLSDETDYGMPGSPEAFQLAEINDWLYLFDPRSGHTTLFDLTNDMYRVRAVVDRNANTLQYQYDPDTYDVLQPVRIEDDFGRFIELTYTNIPPDEGYIETVTDHAGRSVQLHYGRPPGDPPPPQTLLEIVDVLGETHQFDYTSIVVTQSWGNLIYADLMSGHRLPAGNTPWTQEYDVLWIYEADNEDDQPAVIRQTDAYGNILHFHYDTNTHTVSVAWPDGGTNVFRHGGRGDPPRAITDPDGGTIGFEVNANNQMVTVSNRLGGATAFTYDADTRELTSITNALGAEWAAEYVMATQQVVNPLNAESIEFTVARLSRAVYADGNEEQFQYDAAGNVTARVDRTGSVWSYEYNAQGQPTAVVPPVGGVQHYVYDAHGRIESMSVAGPIGLTTAFGYDAIGLVTGIVNAAGAQRAYVRDDKGRIVERISELGRTVRFEYDANDNLAAMVDAAGHAVRYTYDLMDRLLIGSNRLGQATHFSYDAMGRLATIIDPNGIVRSNAWTFSGQLESAGLAGGGRRQWYYNAEDILTAYSLPSGATWSFGSDRIGRSTSITNPLGQVITFERAGAGRMIAHTDAAGRRTAYKYDALGRVTSVSNAVSGAVAYAYDGRGLITNIQDFAQAHWAFEYGPEGLLTAHTDPLGRRETRSYDSMGRPIRHENAGLYAEDLARDAEGTVTQRLATAVWDPTGVSITRDYDELGRLTATDEMVAQYNAEGQLTNALSGGVAFGAAYDPGGRLVELTYADGALTVTYAYDAQDRLTNVSDSLSGATVALIYDADGQVEGLQRGNGMHTAWTYDAAGNVRSIQHGATHQIQYAYDASGAVTQEVRNLPLQTAPHLVADHAALDYDDAAQIATAGYAYDPRGALTNAPRFSLKRDAAGRVAEIRTGDVTVVSYSYNGLNDPFERAQSGVVHVEHYHQALPGSRLAAERNLNSGVFERFYIWTPGGTLLYMADAMGAAHYYHFDRMGHTLFLTDETGAVAQSYAYTPYGQVVAAQGALDQPFQYVGSVGVRKLPGTDGLYRMGVRCYDAVAARFLSTEPLWPRLFDPAALNPYNYAYNAPTRWVDVDGRDPEVNLFRALFAGVTFDDFVGAVYANREDGDWLGVINDLHIVAGQVEGQHLLQEFLNRPDLPQRLAVLEERARQFREKERQRELEEQKQKKMEAERLAARKKQADREAAIKREAEEREKKEKFREWLRVRHAGQLKRLDNLEAERLALEAKRAQLLKRMADNGARDWEGDYLQAIDLQLKHCREARSDAARQVRRYEEDIMQLR